MLPQGHDGVMTMIAALVDQVSKLDNAVDSLEGDQALYHELKRAAASTAARASGRWKSFFASKSEQIGDIIDKT